MPWLKYRHKFAHGKGSWEWKYIGERPKDEDDIKEIARELADQYDYSDKYRGIDYEIEAVAPLWVINYEIEENDRRFRAAEEYARRLDEMHAVGKVCRECSDAPRITRTLTLGRTLDCETCGRNAVGFEPYPEARRAR